MSSARAVWRRPDIQGGSPCIRGTRIPVRAVQSFLRAGYSPEAVVKEYPTLTVGQVEAVRDWGRPTTLERGRG